MIDLFAIVLTHGLLALAAWRLAQRTDLDRDPPPRTDIDDDMDLPPPARPSPGRFALRRRGR